MVRALIEEPFCTEVVLVNRKAISLTADPRCRQVILDTAAPRFAAEECALGESLTLVSLALILVDRSLEQAPEYSCQRPLVGR